MSKGFYTIKGNRLYLNIGSLTVKEFLAKLQKLGTEQASNALLVIGSGLYEVHAIQRTSKQEHEAQPSLILFKSRKEKMCYSEKKKPQEKQQVKKGGLNRDKRAFNSVEHIPLASKALLAK